jgi:hypothetical protein
MRTVLHQSNLLLNWIDVSVKAMGGSIHGNFIKGNNEIYEGVSAILNKIKAGANRDN